MWPTLSGRGYRGGRREQGRRWLPCVFGQVASPNPSGVGDKGVGEEGGEEGNLRRTGGKLDYCFLASFS